MQLFFQFAKTKNLLINGLFGNVIIVAYICGDKSKTRNHE